mgnify:CR=1 FL=1
MVNVNTILNEIAKLNNFDDINQVVRAVNAQGKKVRARNQRKAQDPFREGDEVAFVGKRGERVTGTVDKINPRTIGVIDDVGRKWRVDPQLLMAPVKKNKDVA